jgi:hypothetical protein
MKQEVSPLRVKELFDAGRISAEEAEYLFTASPDDKSIVARPMSKEEKRVRPIGLEEYVPQGHKLDNYYYFVKEKEQYLFLKREELKAHLKHVTGTVTFGIAGFADAVEEGVGHLVSDVAGNATFMVSRTINRAKEGWRKGKM